MALPPLPPGFTLDEDPPPPPGFSLDSEEKKPIPSRTTGESFKDFGAGLVSGTGAALQFPGQLYGLVTGNMPDDKSGIYGLGKALQREGEEAKSAALRAEKAELNKKIAGASGLLEEAGIAGKGYLTNPALLSDLIAETLPQMAAPTAVGRTAVAGTKAASKLLGKEASEATARRVGTGAVIGTGAVQQGADIGSETYEETYKELIKQGVPEDQAKEKAVNLARASGASAAVISLLVQKLPGARRLERTLAGVPGAGGRLAGAVKTGLGETFSEGLEEAGGKLSQNVAMRQVNPEQDLTKGVAAAGVMGALPGGVLGAGAGALQTPAKQTPVSEEQTPDLGGQTPVSEQPNSDQAFKQQLLLGYTPKAEPKANPLKNPVGNFTKEDLGKNLFDFVNAARVKDGLGKLNSISIEDLVNAGVTKESVDQLLSSRIGFEPDTTLSSADVLKIAKDRNVDTDTVGFKHFLARATGTEDVGSMSQAQLQSAFKTLSELKPSKELRVIPEGTNATRFTEDQYVKALKGVNLALAEEPSLRKTSVLKEIQEFTGLENTADAEAILNTAFDRNDLEFKQSPHYALLNENGRVLFAVNSIESAERAVEKAKANGKQLTIKKGAAIDVTLPGEQVEYPGGPDVRRGEFTQGESPEGYEVISGSNILNTFASEDEAHAAAEKFGASFQEDAKAIQKKINRLNSEINNGEKDIYRMKVSGLGSGLNFEKQAVDIAAKNEALKSQIAELEKQKINFLRPLTVKATKGVNTVTKQGYTYFEDDKPVATFDTREKADAFAVSRLEDGKLEAISNLGPTLKGLRAKSLGKLAERELGLRKRKEPGISVEYKVQEGETEEQAKERVKANLLKRGVLSAAEQKARAEESQASQEMLDKADAIIADLRPMLNRFGLEKVGISIVESIRNGTADGFYAKQLIRIALDAKDPIGTTRHETIHALKEMGAFTPEQWKVLESRAKKEWIQKFIVDQGLFDEYQKVYKAQNKGSLEGFDEYIAEEAIADAFKFYKKPQPGLLGNIIYRMRQFFEALKNAFNKNGFKTADQVFAQIEEGKAKPTQEGEGNKYSLIRPAVPGEIEIATQNPQGKSRKYDPYTQMLSIDEKAILEAMESNPDLRQKMIDAIKDYAFIRKDIPDGQVIEDFKLAIVDNLLFLYNSVPAEIRERSKLWYKGANRLAVDMAKEYNISMPQVAGIMAAMSPQKDWFQNVSMAERAIDILSKQGNKAWDANMLKYAESYVKEAENIKDREARDINFEKMKATANAGTLLNNMNEEEAAFFIRSFDEAYNSRDYRLVTPEGGFGDFVRNNDGKLATMMWSTYIPLEKTVSIFRNGSRDNISDQLGNEHKIRSFYNNIASPDSDIGHVTIDTHAVAAGLFESLAGSDTEVLHNFGAIGGSDPIGVSGTYGIIADAYREAAEIAGVKPREMQSITWEAVRGIFDENIKSSLKAPAKAEWNKYRNGEISFEQARVNILEIAKEKLKNTKKQEWFKPDWFDSDRGGYVSEGVSSYDKDFVPAGGVRLRTEVPVKYKVSIQLSAATESIPGIKQLYAEAMSGNSNSYSVLQKVAESRLNFLIGGTDARIKTNYVKGVYKSDREPAILSTVTFREFDKTAVLAGLAQFAKNFNQQQIHVRQPTAYEFNHNYDDGSYATSVYEINLKEELADQQIREIVEQIGLDGFTITPAVKDEPAKLTTYWVRDLTENESEQRAGFERFVAKVEEARRLVGRGTEKSRRTIERLYVFGDGGIGYDTISGDLRTKKEADEVTPKIVAEHFKQESVKAFKQKDLTASQVKEQKLLAGVFERLPINDLNNPIVRKAYEEAAKDLVAQYNALPIKAEVMADVEIDGKIYSYWGLPNRELNRNGVEDLKKVLMSEMSAQDADAAIKYLRKSFGKPNPRWTGILKRVKAVDVDPYKNNSDAVRKDASLNNRLLVYKTSPRTFGPKGVDFKGHPLLEDSGVKDIHGYPMLYNDVLRVVHDYFAHNLSSTSFGPKGEFAAQRNHMATTNNPWSRWAIIAETRAQNAWQNFRPGVEGLSPRDRGFALQKAALPPIQFALTGDNQVDAPVLDLMKELTFEQQMGSLDPSSPLTAQVKKLTPVEKPVPKTEEKPVPQETEEGRYSLRGLKPTTTKDNIIFSLQDKQIDLKRVIDELKSAGVAINDKWNTYLQEELFHGRASARSKRFVDKELVPLLKKMDQANISLAEMDDYLLARHAPEANAYIRTINNDPNANAGMTDQQARQHIASIPPARRQVFENIALDIDKVTRETRKLMVDYGLETQATINKWEQDYRHYVPLFREETEGSPISAGRGYSIRGSTTRSRTGSSQKVVDVLANIALQRERTVTRGEKNRVGNSLFGLIVQNPEPDFWLAIDPVQMRTTNQANFQAELVSMGIPANFAQTLASKPVERVLNPATGNYEFKTNPMWLNQPNVFVTRVNGQDRVMIFNKDNERAARMAYVFNNLDAGQQAQAVNMLGVVGKWIDKASGTLGKSTRYFAGVNTQYNPAFGVFNFLRDVGGASINLQATPLKGKEAKVLMGAFSALKSIYKDLRLIRSGQQPSSSWAAIFEEFEEEGGKTGFRDLFYTAEDRSKEIQSVLSSFKEPVYKAIPRKAIDWLSDFNEAIENCIRVSTYKVAKQDLNLSKERSASLAKNITVNFNRSGAVNRKLSMWYAFFNASVQGTAKIAQTLMDPNGKLTAVGKKIILGGVSLGVFQALLLAMYGFDEDEPPEFVKDKSFVIPYGDKKYLAVPLPLGYNAFPAFGRRVAEFVMSDDKNFGKSFVSMGAMILDSFNPLGSATPIQTLMPTIADPLVALAENKDFAGRPIAKDDINSLNPTPGYTRGKENASAITTGLAYAINWMTGGTEDKKGAISPTPDQISFLVGEITGGVGRELLKVEKLLGSAITGEELATYNIPVVGRLIGDINQKSVITSRFYENVKAMNEHQNALKGMMTRDEDFDPYFKKYPEAELYSVADSLYNSVNKLKAEKKLVKEQGATSEEIKEYDEMILEIMQVLNEEIRAAKKEGS